MDIIEKLIAADEKIELCLDNNLKYVPKVKGMSFMDFMFNISS